MLPAAKILHVWKPSNRHDPLDSPDGAPASAQRRNLYKMPQGSILTDHHDCSVARNPPPSVQDPTAWRAESYPLACRILPLSMQDPTP